MLGSKNLTFDQSFFQGRPRDIHAQPTPVLRVKAKLQSGHNTGNEVLNSTWDRHIPITAYRSISIILCVMSALSGINQLFSYAAAWIWLACILLVFNRDDFYTFLLPLTLFEGKFFVFPGIVLIKVLVIIYMMRIVVKRKAYLNVSRSVLFVILAGYGMLSLAPFLGGMAPTVIFVITMLTLFDNIGYMGKKEIFSRTLFLYAIIGISSALYGLITNNYYAERFCGATSDPNVLGVTLVISLIVVFCTKIISINIIKYLLCAFLVYCITLTQSTTALLGIILFALVYSIMNKSGIKQKVTIFAILVLLLFVVFNLDSVISFSINNNIISPDSRSLEHLSYFANDDMSGATSMRTDIWIGYLDYFREQGLLRQLFGGNVTGIYGIEKNFSNMNWKAATHNTQLDILICLGLIGLIAFTYYYFTSLKRVVQLFYATKDKEYLMAIGVKLTVLLYSFSLSFFPSIGLMGLYLI